MSGSIETGTRDGYPEHTVLGVRLFTNRGRSMLAEAQNSTLTAEGTVTNNGIEYRDHQVHYFDCPFSQGTLKGFFGRSIDSSAAGHGVLRLGFIWGDVLLPQPADASETQPVSGSGLVKSSCGEMKSSQTPPVSGPGPVKSCCGEMKGSNLAKTFEHAARFGVTYPTPPKIIYAFSGVRGHDASHCRPLSWQHTPDSNGLPVSVEGFRLKTYPYAPIDTLNYSWLTLPENEVTFNSGSYDFGPNIDDNQENATATHQVVFTKPYKTAPAPPAVWCVTMDHTSAEGFHWDGRLRHRISDLTATGFKLTIETWNGARHAGNVWGWCTWDKEYDGVKVQAESKMVYCGYEDGSNGGMEEPQKWVPAFPGGKPPVSIMTGINGYDINMSSSGWWTALWSRWEKPDLTDTTGKILCGTDLAGRTRYVSAMYLAILEE